MARNCRVKMLLVASFAIILVGGLLAGCAPKLALPQFSESRLDKWNKRGVAIIEENPSTQKPNQSDVQVQLPAPFKEAFELQQQESAASARTKSAVEKESRSLTSQNQIRLNVNVYKYAFEPDAIIVPYGKNVTITFQSMDVRHGIAIPDFGINEPIPAEDFVRVHFESTKHGTFPFFSSVYSGEGYKNMKGTITII